MKLAPHTKVVVEDQEIDGDVSNEDLSRHVLRRVFAVNRVFVNVNFKQSEISECYFRNCVFRGCDFTGANIRRSNLRGSRYEGCTFNYSTWEHTQLDEEFLDSCLPSEENLARDLVRSLRVNFGHIGNYAAVNKAAAIEVKYTGLHLHEAAFSKQSYYRRKYVGIDRVISVLRYTRWKLLDLLWGNGESIGRILLAGLGVVALSAACLACRSPHLTAWDAWVAVVAAFWGLGGQQVVPDSLVVLLTIVRFVFVGLFMAILVKRLAQR